MKTWLITGASTGFGRELAEQLLLRGDRVAATLRNPEMLSDLKEQYENNLWLATLDVTDTKSIREVIACAFSELCVIDVVVNSAGYALFCAAEEAMDHQIDRQIETNLMGSIRMIRAVLPYFRAQGHGRIIQMSSAGSQATYPNFSYYNATKWGIEGFCETLAKEVKPLNIEVTIIQPGGHQTSNVANLDTAPVMLAYDDTPAGEIRRIFESGKIPVTSDLSKSVQSIIACADTVPAPLRIALGSDAYDNIHTSLSLKLKELEAQKAIAMASKVKDSKKK